MALFKLYAPQIVSKGQSTPPIFIKENFYVFGGDYYVDTIGRLNMKTRKWFKVGQLNRARTSSRVIFDGLNIFVVGGDALNVKYLESEKCEIVKQGIKCVLQNPNTSFYTNPGLFLVDEDFCNPKV